LVWAEHNPHPLLGQLVEFTAKPPTARLTYLRPPPRLAAPYRPQRRARHL